MIDTIYFSKQNEYKFIEEYQFRNPSFIEISDPNV